MRKGIIVFSSSWGTRYGGIDSFNYDFCIAIADILKSEKPKLCVVCILNEGNSAEVQEAKSFDVICQPLPHVTDSALDFSLIDRWLKGAEIEPVYVLGHDVHTGFRANNFASFFGIKCAIFHHMNYRAYKPEDYTAVKRQENIFSKDDIDIVFAVGPKLKESAESILNKVNGNERVIELLPGVSDRQQYITAQTPPNFLAITLGRVNLENDLVKQIKLAVASFGRAVLDAPHLIRDRQPSLTIIGLSGEEINKASKEEISKDKKSLQKLANDYANGNAPVGPWPYERDRGVLFSELANKTVCMVLSWYEGFSLVGLEAISVGVPLILSRNTGLYKALEREAHIGGTGCIYPVDVSADGDIPDKDLSEVVTHLRKIASNTELAKRNALSLRENLISLWTWKNTATSVLDALDIPNEHDSDLAGSDTKLTSVEPTETSNNSNSERIHTPIDNTTKLEGQTPSNGDVIDIYTGKPLHLANEYVREMKQLQRAVKGIKKKVYPLQKTLEKGQLNMSTKIPKIEKISISNELLRFIKRRKENTISANTAKQLLESLNQIQPCLKLVKRVKYQSPSQERNKNISNCLRTVSKVYTDADLLLTDYFPQFLSNHDLL